MSDANFQDNMIYLVEYLCRERRMEEPAELHDLDTADLWQLFRALVNTRQPVQAEAEFYRVQDQVLQAILHDEAAARACGLSFAPVAHVASLPTSPRDERISFYHGDICRIDADAIVNAANSQMLGCWVPGHFCIDNAIHTFAGVQLREECARIMADQGHEEPTGQAKVTGAYNLPAKHVVHTVGPIAQGRVDAQLKADLASSYRNCLDAAAQAGCASIVFCCISTGVFGFPNEDAAEVAVSTVREWLATHPATPMQVVFDLFGDRDRAIYAKLLG